MEFANIFAFIAALSVAAFSVYLSRQSDAAGIEADQAKAFGVYWNQIRTLEEDKAALKNQLDEIEQRYQAKIVELERQNERLWAEIGRLKSQMNGG